MKLGKILNWALAFFISFFICFGLLLKKDSVLISIICVLVLMIFLIKKINDKEFKIKIFKNDLLLLMLIIIMLCSMIYTIDYSLSIKYIGIFMILFIIKILLNNLENERLVEIGNFLTFFSGIHVLATYVYMIFPDIIMNINKVILTASEFEDNVLLYEHGFNAGISGDHAYNAFFITIFTMSIFAKICYHNKERKNKKILYILLFLGIVALILTKKRGLILGNIGAILIIVIARLKQNRKKVIKVIKTSIVCIGVVIILLQFPITQEFLERFSNDGDTTLLNGREDIYGIVEQNIKENFILGSGINTTQIVTNGNDAHNTYLQIISELGIFGTCFYMLFFIYNYIYALKRVNMSENMTYSIYYQTFFLIYSFTGNPLYQLPTLFMYIYILCLNNTLIKQKYELESGKRE